MITDPETQTSVYEAPAQLLKLLAHPARLAILNILRDGEHCVCHLEAHLNLRQAYISQQLMLLREAGLIEDRRDGWNVFYRVSDARVFAVLDAAGAGLPAANGAPPAPVDCPCPHCKSSGKEGESQS